MAKNKITAERLIKLAKIEELQADLDDRRKDLGISAKGEELVNDEVHDDRRLVVVADGLGGADLEHVEGHYPIDHLELHSRHYRTEDEACADCARLSACYQGDGSAEEEDEGKDWDDLIEEIFGDKDDENTVEDKDRRRGLYGPEYKGEKF